MCTGSPTWSIGIWRQPAAPSPDQEKSYGEERSIIISDDGRPLPTAAITRRALQYVKVSKRFVAILPNGN